MKNASNQKISTAKLAEKLADACGAGDIQTVKALLAQGAKPDGFMESEGAPLYEAVKTGNLDTLRILLDSGADPNLSNPLAQACERGLVSIAAMLIKHGADVNRGRAIEFAVSYAQPKAVRFLLKHGVRIESRLLNWAVTRPHAEKIAKLLLQAGANPNHHDLDSCDDPSVRGQVPLHLTGNNPKLTKLLLDSGADPNRQYFRSKRTPLLSAAKHGNLEVTRMLLNAGANVRHVDADGKTAEQIAKKHNHTKLAEFLKNFAKEETSTAKAQQTIRKTPKAPQLLPVVQLPKISIPRLAGTALRFATGLSDFVSHVDERGGNFGLIAVESSIKKVVPLYFKRIGAREMRADIQVSGSKKDDPISNRWTPIVQPTGTPWTIIYSHVWFNLDGVDNRLQKDLEAMSLKLKTRVFALVANSDGAVCRLFDKGVLVGVNSVSRVDKINGLLKWLEVYIPACYATEEDKNGAEFVRLAVCPTSSGRIVSAAAFLASD